MVGPTLRFMREIEEVADEDVYAELRRRGVTQREVMGAMQWAYIVIPRRPAAAIERQVALVTLAVLGGVLVALIGYLAIQGKEPPSLLSGLAGTCIGAIAGLLAPKPAVGELAPTQPEGSDW